MRKPFALIAALPLLLLSVAATAALSTRTINYQGQLTDLADNTVSGPQNMAFELYGSASGGSPIYSWATTAVPVTRGLFNVELPMPTLTTAQMNAELWLQVTVAGNVMSPRKQMLAGVFALNAESLQGHAPGSNGGDIPMILTGTGKLDPAIVSSPFPLTVSGNGGGTGAAGIFINYDNGAGQTGLKASGNDYGIKGDSLSTNGTGIYGAANASDGGSATGVLGEAINGVGVRAKANAAGTTALQALNPGGLGIFGGSGLWGAQLGASLIGLRIGGAGLGGQAAATPDLGLEIFSNQRGIVVNNSGSLPAISSVNSGVGVAIEGKVTSANGVGLRGEHAGLGFGTGVWGLSNAAGGTGVRGEHGATSGNGVGVDGSSGSPDGIGVRGSGVGTGVYGIATDSVDTGDRVGVRGRADAPNGIGVRGQATGASKTYGVYGLADASATGAGVYGESPLLGVQGVASSSNSAAIGVQGKASAKGVQGVASQSVGSASIGVDGSSASPDGIGVRGQALATGSGAAVGVRGEASATQGVGVLGVAPAAGVKGTATAGNGHGLEGNGGTAGSGTNRAGVYGALNLANGESGYGIYGTVNGSSGDGYAIYAYANASGHRALRAYNVTATNSDAGYALGVEGKFKIGTSNAGSYVGTASAVQSWQVATPYCGSGDSVLVTPQVDITNGGTVANAIWVAPGDVIDGSFTVRSAAKVSNMSFNYLVIDRN